MRRREFIGLVGGAVAWPVLARAQQPGHTYRIGFLIPSPRDRAPVAALFDELRLNGFIENQNLEVLPGGFDAHDEQFTELAAALVKAAPDVIVAGPELPLRAVQKVTRAVPLVGMSEDLVAEGLVASLARPGANITGISLLSPELDGKRQDILIESGARSAPHRGDVRFQGHSTLPPSGIGARGTVAGY
jgi:putative ABC transport system substrate-binding protein